jgi:uncharacterized membrane protein (DUF485 family)
MWVSSQWAEVIAISKIIRTFVIISVSIREANAKCPEF